MSGALPTTAAPSTEHKDVGSPAAADGRRLTIGPQYDNLESLASATAAAAARKKKMDSEAAAETTPAAAGTTVEAPKPVRNVLMEVCYGVR